MATLKLIDKTALNNLAVGINKIINDRIKIEADRATASEGSLQTSINNIPVGTITQHTTDIAAINNATTGILATAKSYADTKAGAVQTNLNTVQTSLTTVSGKVDTNTTNIASINNSTTGILITAKNYADTKAGAVQTNLNTVSAKVDTNTTNIAAINNATTGILATAKSYADTKAGAVQTSLNTVSGKVNTNASNITSIISVNTSQDTKISTLETKVGAEKTETVAATGLIKDLRQAQTDIDAIEVVIGNSSSGLTKQINTNATNIATHTANIATHTTNIATLTSDVAVIKGTGVGSLSQTLTDAKAYSDAKVAAIVDSAPETLDTLKELSTALGNDANFATTISAQIGTKASQADMTTVQNKLAGISTTVTSYVNAKDTAMGTRVTSLETSLGTTGAIGTRIGSLETSLSSTGAIGKRIGAIETSLTSTGTVGTKISTLESSMAVIKGASTVEGSMAKLKSDLTSTIANSISSLNLAITADTNSYSIALKLSDQVLNTAILQLETITDTEVNEILAALV